MPENRTKRSVQIPMLRAAALALAEQQGKAIAVENMPVTEVRLPSLYFWLWPLGARTSLDVWDESRGGAKVLNMNWLDDAMEVLSFRRGNWEDALLSRARQDLH